MTRLEELLDQLVDAFTAGAAHASGLDCVITDIDLDLPVEARIGQDGVLLATLPRGLLATGFESPLGRLRVHCEEPRQ